MFSPVCCDANTHTHTHLMAISDEHGRGYEAVSAVDCGALLIVQVVAARAYVGG